MIYFVRKEEREFSTAALGNSRPFCPPSLQSFFLAGPVLYLFIPCFPTLGCRLQGFGSSSGTRSPETRFGCPFIGFSFSASPFCTLVLHLCIFLSYCSPFKVISKKAQKGCRGSFSLRWRLGLWVEKPSEDLPKALENPIKQLTQRAVHKIFFKELRWSHVCAKSLLPSCDYFFQGAEEVI